MDFVTVAAFRPVSGVVVEGDHFAVAVLRDVAGMVLEAEVHIGTESEIGLLAPESPDDFAGCPVDFVDRAGVARGNEVVTLGVFVDGVDVEVIPGVGGVVAGSCLAGVNWEDGFYILWVSLCFVILIDRSWAYRPARHVPD